MSEDTNEKVPEGLRDVWKEKPEALGGSYLRAQYGLYYGKEEMDDWLEALLEAVNEILEARP